MFDFDFLFAQLEHVFHPDSTGGIHVGPPRK